MKRRGFTLIELLVVIAIIAILAAILFPVFARAREKARQASCSSNQKQIALGILMYAQDYDEAFPGFYYKAVVADWATLHDPSIVNLDNPIIEGSYIGKPGEADPSYGVFRLIRRGER